MTFPNWQLQEPIQAIVFDCDGTLSHLEGVNVLAKNKGVDAQVSTLTEQAMGQTGINPALYAKRLDLIEPHERDIQALGQLYFAAQISGASAIIQILQRLKKAVYLVSAGLTPAVAEFARLLSIPKEHVYAVDVHFDLEGNFVDFDRTSPLVTHDGKRQIITEIKQKHLILAHIGDGLNDYIAHDLVTRFIGFGGAYFRESIAALCDYYINVSSLAPLLPLILTSEEVKYLTSHEYELYHEGLTAIEAGKVKVKR